MNFQNQAVTNTSFNLNAKNLAKIHGIEIIDQDSIFSYEKLYEFNN